MTAVARRAGRPRISTEAEWIKVADAGMLPPQSEPEEAPPVTLRAPNATVMEGRWAGPQPPSRSTFEPLAAWPRVTHHSSQRQQRTFIRDRVLPLPDPVTSTPSPRPFCTQCRAPSRSSSWTRHGAAAGPVGAACPGLPARRQRQAGTFRCAPARGASGWAATGGVGVQAPRASMRALVTSSVTGAVVGPTSAHAVWRRPVSGWFGLRVPRRGGGSCRRSRCRRGPADPCRSGRRSSPRTRSFRTGRGSGH